MGVCDKTPPTPKGMIHAAAVSVLPGDDVAWAAALAAHAVGVRSPSSNTGMIRDDLPDHDAPAFVDYLKFTLRGLRSALEKVRAQEVKSAQADGLDELRQILGVMAVGDWDTTGRERDNARRLLDAVDPYTFPEFAPLEGLALDRGLAWLARTMLEACAPALVFGDLTGKGRDGYRDHLCIYTHLGENCGFIAVGGNRETVHVNLTGQACARIDLAKLAATLDGFDHKISRVDAAWDDFTGRYGPASGAAENYRHGGFTPERGVRSEKVTFIDDMGTGKGSTFNLGDRASRMLRVYEKGKQLGEKTSPWVRYEVQYMAAAFDLTTDHIRNPGMLLLQYPDLDFLPVMAEGDPAVRIRKETEISVEKLVTWLQTTCGAALTLLTETIGATTTADLLENPKTPRRLRRLGNSRQDLGKLVSGALLDSRKFAPIAGTSRYLSATQRANQHEQAAA